MPPDPAVHDAASGELSRPSSPSPSLRTSAAGGTTAVSPGVTPISEDAAESAAVAAPVKSSPAIATRPSLLSRLRLPLQLQLPLRSRNRHIADFHIRCDEPHKKYSAGDSVRGAVVLAVVKPHRITHLVVALHGYVRVLKDPTSVAKAQSVTTLPRPGSSRRPQHQGNGLTSLFQDEQVLSGEGRIEPGKYEFGFDLIFPDKWLPSSIDFERGTISYTITATLTKPISMAPTSTCERKVTLVQQIDVGLLSPPRPRTIFLEPISKRARRKKSTLNEKASGPAAQEINDLTSEAESSVITEDSALNRGEMSNNAQSEARVCPVTPSDMQSEISAESGRSVSTTSRAEFTQLSHVSSALTSAAKQQVVDDKTITATIELLKGGCLPGEAVSVRVTVQHIKRVKSMTGVIVTLFRQSKIDTNPPASMPYQGPRSARRLTKEDPYPRSRTGIGGLSLSSSSSTSVFRKDLDQNAAPLIIDPTTLQASVTVSVRVPDDAFPTIKGVPGDMISFKYQTEVIVDLGGRLTTQLSGASSMSRIGTPGSNNAEQNQNLFGSQRGSNIADTSQVRRQKGVISVSLETVVGTIDSARLRQSTKTIAARQRTIRISEEGEEEEEEDIIRVEATPPRNRDPAYHHHLSPPSSDLDYTTPPPHPADAPQLPWASTGISRNFSQTNGNPRPHAAPSYVPSPEVPNEANMTEKERIRQAETRLLPSQPPAGLSTQADGNDMYDAEDAPRIPRGGPMVPLLDEAEAGPSAPPEDVVDAGRPAEDKQELERRRLLEEASAPPEFPEDMQQQQQRRRRPAAYASASAPPDEPTAPNLGEEEADSYPGYGAGAGPSRAGGAEQLPAYQR
ncbi:hypothetical protein EsDP_00000654 [Epichloe bromicola]|uniref:Arrestin C-terminal-like domain-containing protein n=1 Tax=Epichloe bromicola TaxID=79588 RepID=A0ABQ0CFJ4_9HYPO